MAQKAPLRISIIGAGPAGLYTAILARLHLGDAIIEVIEQNPKGATFGFGVVFSDKALDFLSAGDPQTLAQEPIVFDGLDVYIHVEREPHVIVHLCGL